MEVLQFLYRKDLLINIHSIEKSNDGNVIGLIIENNSEKFAIINMYNPHHKNESLKVLSFADNLISKYKKITKNILIGGDFNSILSKGLDSFHIYKGQSTKTNRLPNPLISEFIENHHLIDSFRELNKNKIKFSREQKFKNTIICSRIDFWFYLTDCSQKIISSDILDNNYIHSDHYPISISVIFETNNKNKNFSIPSTSIFNNNISEVAFKKLNESIDSWIDNVGSELLNKAQSKNEFDHVFDSFSHSIHSSLQQTIGLKDTNIKPNRTNDPELNILFKVKQYLFSVYSIVKKQAHKQTIKVPLNLKLIQKVKYYINKIPSDILFDLKINFPTLLFQAINLELDKLKTLQNNIQVKIKNKIKYIEQQKWINFVEKILDEDEIKPGKLFNLIREKQSTTHIDGVFIPSKLNPKSSEFSSNPSDIKDVFVNWWSDLFKSKNPSGLSDDWFSNLIIDENSKKEILNPITITEWKAIIKYLKNKKAPGYDGINSEILKNMSDKQISFYVDMCNLFFKNGYIPNRMEKRNNQILI